MNRQTTPLASNSLFQALVPARCIAAVRALLRYLFDVATLDQDVNTPFDRRLVNLALLRDRPVRWETVVMLSLKAAEAIIDEFLC